MFFPVKTKDDLIRDFKAALLRSGKFSNFENDSGAMLVAAPVIEAQAQIENNLLRTYDQSQIAIANGSNLDLIGEHLGVYRQGATHSSTKYFRFYTYNGADWSDIRGAHPERAHFPAGTIVYSISDPKLRYRLVNDLYFSGTEMFTEVISEGLGSYYRADASAITGHSSAAYRSLILCENPLAIDNGKDAESDDDYRFRISNKVAQLGGATTIGLQAIVLNIPGVRSAEVVTNSKGPGTVTINILPKSSPADPEIVKTVKSVVEDYIAAGVSAIVTVPQEIGVSLILGISDISQSGRVKAFVTSFFANLGVDQTVHPSEIIYAAKLSEVESVDIHEFEVEGMTSLGLEGKRPPSGYRFYLKSIEVIGL